MDTRALAYVNAVPVSMEELVETAESVLNHFDADEPCDTLIDYIIGMYGCAANKACAIVARMQALARFVAHRKYVQCLEHDRTGEWARALFVCAAAQPLVSAGEEFGFDGRSFTRRMRQFLGIGAGETMH